VDGLIYADLGADNGAILVDLSEGGVGFQSVAPLNLGQAVPLKVKWSGGKNHIESGVEVVWLNESRKRGGLRFVELSADARAQIRAWKDNASAPEAAGEIRQAEKRGNVKSTETGGSPEGLGPTPMREIARSRSTSPADTPVQVPEASGKVATESRPDADSEISNPVSSAKAPGAQTPTHSSAAPIPGKSSASAEWQESCLSALYESDPQKRREWLVRAEKAILRRLTLLGENAGGPESQALRSALDSLYALKKEDTPRTSKIVYDRVGYELERSRRASLLLSVALAVLVSFTFGWVLSTRNEYDQIAEAPTNSTRAGDFEPDLTGSAHDDPVLDKLPERAPQTSLLPNATIAPDVGGTKMRIHAGAKAIASPRAIARDHDVAFENGQLPESTVSMPANRASRPPENPPTQALGALPNEPKEGSPTALSIPGRPNVALDTPAPRQDSSPPSPEPQAKPIPAGSKASELQARSEPPANAAEPQGNPQIYAGSVSVSFSNYPSIRVPPELKSQASGASLQIAQLISHMDPVYPQDAERQHIEGTVKLHAIVGRDGAVQNVEVTTGPPLLASAALSAVRQWRYKPTLLADQPIETREEITIIFRLTPQTPTSN
jgi:protein TonB